MSPILGSLADTSAGAYGLFSAPLAIPGNYYSIQTITVGAGGASNIQFTSIPSTYTHLQIRYSGFVSGDAWLQFNGDTGTSYSRHSLFGNGSTPSYYAGTSQNYIGFAYTSSATNPSISIVDFLDYANTNKYKTTRHLNGDDQNGSGIIMLASGLWQNTNAINSIKIYPNAGNFSQSSSFALYGVK